jgi:hypothetical protein
MERVEEPGDMTDVDNCPNCLTGIIRKRICGKCKTNFCTLVVRNERRKNNTIPKDLTGITIRDRDGKLRAGVIK